MPDPDYLIVISEWPGGRWRLSHLCFEPFEHSRPCTMVVVVVLFMDFLLLWEYMLHVMPACYS